jgi:hypothetical protein
MKSEPFARPRPKPESSNAENAVPQVRTRTAGFYRCASLVLTGVLLADASLCRPVRAAEPRVMMLARTSAQDAEAKAEAKAEAEAKAKQRKVIIEAIEPEGGTGSTQEIAWLGVSAEEVSEALDAQLGLQPGEGLLVTYVAADSPAGTAGLQKNDVLTQLGDQTLVHPMQLRKLVRMHKAGDKVDLIVFRSGKKRTLSATLAKTTRRVSLFEEGDIFPGGIKDLHHQFSDIKIGDQVRDQIKTLHESLLQAGLDKNKLNLEINRSLDEVRKAIHEALRHATNPQSMKELEQLMKGGVGMGKDTTVVVRNDRKSVKTIVKTDDAGSYVIVANPTKHLTVHDDKGKLVFDGEIETSEQQKKVPQDIWEKVQPMLEQMNSDKPTPMEDEDTKGDQGASLEELTTPSNSQPASCS